MKSLDAVYLYVVRISGCGVEHAASKMTTETVVPTLHFKSHNAAVLEKRNNRLSLTYDRQKHIGNAHVDIVTIYNLQFMRNLMESLENEAPLEPTCFACNLKTAR